MRRPSMSKRHARMGGSPEGASLDILRYSTQIKGREIALSGYPDLICFNFYVEAQLK
jgi:hypothetical protein